MVSFVDCPLAIRHKKGEYIWMEIGGVFCFLEAWSFRLYLGASSCIYLFWLLMYLFFMGCICKGETLCFFVSFIVSCHVLR